MVLDSENVHQRLSDLATVHQSSEFKLEFDSNRQ